MKILKSSFIITTMTILTLLACNLGPAPTALEQQTVKSPAPDKFTLVKLQPGAGSLEDQLKIEAQKAGDLGQTPFVECTADWCPPCRALRKSLTDERMIDAFTGTYIIQVDVDAWDKQLSRAGFNVRGIPAFFEIDQQGQPTGRIITGGAWGEDIPENMAPPLRDFFSSAGIGRE
jgi:thiol:disulfide interchange protein